MMCLILFRIEIFSKCLPNPFFPHFAVFFFPCKRIQSNLYAQLMLNEKWGASMQHKVKEVVRNVVLQQGGGISEITLDELVENLSVQSNSNVPKSIKEDTMEQIKAACELEEETTSE